MIKFLKEKTDEEMEEQKTDKDSWQERSQEERV